MNFYIEMDSFKAPKITLKQIHNSTEFSKQIINTSSENTKYLESLYQLQKGTVKLDEVVLKTTISKQDSLKNKKRFLYKESSQTLDFKEITVLPTDNALSVLRGRVPGYSSSGVLRGANTMTGSNLPLYLLNGMPVDTSAITSIPISNIDFVDVIKGPRAAIYGSRSANGVIAVYTIDGTESSKSGIKNRGIISFIHPGYSQVRKFYEPVYKTQKKEEEQFDYRSTIYWNPRVIPDEKGKAKVSFYTSDANSPYRIVLEGITLKGKIIKKEIILNK
jgi:hypothetical protein